MQDDLEKAKEVLINGGTILFPNDSQWAIGCDATNPRAVDKIYRIKFKMPQKSMIILASNIEMVASYVTHVPDVAVDLANSFKDSITIIYNNARNLARNIIDDDGSIGIKIPKDDFCLRLISLIGKPIAFTSANISGEPLPVSFSKINSKIKAQVDYICKSNHESVNSGQTPTIVRITIDGQIEIIKS